MNKSEDAWKPSQMPGELTDSEIAEIDAIIQETLTNEFRANLPQKDYESTLQEVIDRKLSPWEAVTKLIDGRKV